MYIGFYGGDSQVGTTMVSLSTAEMLAKQGHRVLFIGAGQEPAIPFLSVNVSSSADNLRWALQEEVIAEKELCQSLITSRNVDILPVAYDWNCDNFYEKGGISKLYQLMEMKYEYIVIDGGSDWERSSIDTLRNCDLACVVVTQQAKSLERAQQRIRMTAMALPQNTCCLINKFQAPNLFGTGREVGNRLGFEEENILQVDYVPYGWQAERERVTLLNHRLFRKGVQGTAEYIKKEERRLGYREKKRIIPGDGSLLPTVPGSGDQV
ncbi:MAG: ParA family protein [Firmicutes bacterium]|nr:ParA family protein [Bacillota bacterium]